MIQEIHQFLRYLEKIKSLICNSPCLQYRYDYIFGFIFARMKIISICLHNPEITLKGPYHHHYLHFINELTMEEYRITALIFFRLSCQVAFWIVRLPTRIQYRYSALLTHVIVHILKIEPTS